MQKQAIQRKLPIGTKTGTQGRYRFITRDSITGEIKRTSDWNKNLVMNGTGTGVNLIARLLGNDSTYPLAITKAKIGTGTNVPADADVDLQTPTLTKNTVADQIISGNIVTISFFLTNAELANGTYTEFGIFAGDQLFARSIISPSYVKGSNEDTTVEYEITVNNT